MVLSVDIGQVGAIEYHSIIGNQPVGARQSGQGRYSSMIELKKLIKISLGGIK